MLQLQDYNDEFQRVIVRQSFSTAEAARLTGLSARQLDHWDRQGFLRPSLERASGYGSARRYSFADIVRLRVAARLRNAGHRPAEDPPLRGGAHRASSPKAPADLAEARLLVAGNRVLWARSDRELVDLLKEGQMVLVFSLGEAVADAAGAVERLVREVESEDLPSAPSARRSRRTALGFFGPGNAPGSRRRWVGAGRGEPARRVARATRTSTGFFACRAFGARSRWRRAQTRRGEILAALFADWIGI